MDFRQRLLALVELAEQKGDAELSEKLDLLTEKLIAVLKGGSEDFDREALTADARAVGRALRFLDAAQCVDQRMFSDKQAVIVEVELAGDAVSDRAKVKGVLQERRLTRKSYVLVAYDASDERKPFVYVGRGNGSKALPLKGSNRLANAVKQSNRLALLFPRQGTRGKLTELEHAMIYLVRCKTGANPTFNASIESKMPDSEGWQRLEALSDFLETAGIHVFNQALEDDDR